MEEQAKKIAELLKLLANEHRLLILDVYKRQGKRHGFFLYFSIRQLMDKYKTHYENEKMRPMD